MTTTIPTNTQADEGGAPGEMVLVTGRIGRRSVAAVLDAVLLAIGLAVGVVLVGVIYVLTAGTIDDCSISRDGSCDPSVWLDRTALGLAAVWAIVSAHLLLTRPVHNGRGSWGMRQVGLTVVSNEPGVVISRTQAQARTWVSQPILWAYLAVVAVLAVDDASFTSTIKATIVVAAIVALVASLILVLLPGHRSLADAVSGTRVVHVRRPSVLAAIAAVVVPLPALTAAASVWNAAAGRPDMVNPGVRFGGRNYDDFDWWIDFTEWLWDAGEWFTDDAVGWVLLVAMWLACCALTWFALRSTRWRNDRLDGRALALFAGLWCAAPIVTLVLRLFWELGSNIIDRVS